MNIETESDQVFLKQQREKIASLYDGMSAIYEDQFEGKAEYQVPNLLLETYAKYGINGGEILDVGCGTGKLCQYLGDNFTYIGIDISAGMIEQAKKKGYKGIVGPVEDVIRNIPDKSVDHIVALSSLYFIRDYDQIVGEFERVARKSLFITLEQFTPEVIEMMKAKGIKLFNHPSFAISDATEVITNIYLWKRPNTEDKIFGDVVFKKFS